MAEPTLADVHKRDRRYRFEGFRICTLPQCTCFVCRQPFKMNPVRITTVLLNESLGSEQYH